MRKICILQNGMHYGGTDTFVLNLTRGLLADGYRVTVILTENETTAREAELEGTGCRLRRTTSLDGAWAKLRHLKQLYSILRDEKPDIFQTNIDLFNGPQMFISWLAGVPIRECHSHNSQQSRAVSSEPTLSVVLYQKAMRWLCWTFSNRRGGCSELAMDFLFGEKWKNDPHSRVIHNGIDLSAFKKEYDIEKKKDELGLTKKYTLCTVGRMDYQKNPLFIVEILNALFKRRDDCDFAWVGKGAMEEEVRERIIEYRIEDRVHLLRPRKDVPEIMKCCDAFLLPSHFEGLGIVLTEAQAANLVCVTSDTTPEESNCGGCLYLPIERGADFWAEEINEVLDGKEGLVVDDNLLSKFSIENMVQEMEALLSYV